MVFIGEFIHSIVEILVFVCREGLVSGGIGDRLLHLMRCYRGATKCMSFLFPSCLCTTLCLNLCKNNSFFNTKTINKRTDHWECTSPSYGP